MVVITEEFKEKCLGARGKPEIVNETVVCIVEDPHIREIFGNMFAMVELTRQTKMPEITSLVTSGPKPEHIDFVFYEDPSLVTELLRFRWDEKKEKFVVMEFTQRFEELKEELE